MTLGQVTQPGSIPQELHSQSNMADRPLPARVCSDVLEHVKQTDVVLRRRGLKILQSHWEHTQAALISDLTFMVDVNLLWPSFSNKLGKYFCVIQ